MSCDGRQPFRFGPITEADAAAIARWRYAAPHAAHDSDGETALPPAHLRVHAVHRHGRLFGSCSFGEDGQVPGYDYDDSATDVGAGMAPECTGRGAGREVLTAVLAHPRSELGFVRLGATIAAWNERALRAASSAGFEDRASFAAPDGRSFRVLIAEPPPPTPLPAPRPRGPMVLTHRIAPSRPTQPPRSVTIGDSPHRGQSPMGTVPGVNRRPGCCLRRRLRRVTA